MFNILKLVTIELLLICGFAPYSWVGFIFSGKLYPKKRREINSNADVIHLKDYFK